MLDQPSGSVGLFVSVCKNNVAAGSWSQVTQTQAQLAQSVLFMLNASNTFFSLYDK